MALGITCYGVSYYKLTSQPNKLPVNITNCWKFGHSVVKAKWFSEQSMTLLQSNLNEFWHMRGKWGNTVFTCDHTLDNFNSLAPLRSGHLRSFHTYIE